jgi:hypothetical protein
MTFFLTRINVGDYDAWKPAFDSDGPGARASARGHRIFRSVDNPNEVYILVEFKSAEDARAGRDRLLQAGVLGRFEDKSGPTVVEEAEAVTYEARPAELRRASN